MKKETHISHAISIAEDKSAYNEHAINILKDLHILANIMKGVLLECRDMSISEIINAIEGTIEVKTMPVYPGEIIQGDRNEDVVPNEGTIVYDIRFHARIPQIEDSIKILINVEAQQNYFPGYDLVTRGIYYATRMISSQYNVEFEHGNYDGIKKVYSIWICTNAPNYAKNTITEYKIQQEKIFGDFQGNPRYDILSVIFLCLGDSSEENSPKYLSMLSIALGNHIKEEKKRRLEDEFGIPMTIELEKEINEMCNLADAIEEKGLKRGIEQGIEQGTIQILSSLVRDNILSVEEAAKRAHMTVEEFEKKLE